MNYQTRILELELENATLRQEVTSLEEKLLQVLQQLEQQPVKKDSHNSHNPPSQDKSKPKRTKSLRKKSGRKPGGQPGHKGHTLKQVEHPTKQYDLKSNFCQSCGSALPESGQELLSKRQVVELPPISPIYIEYRQFGCTCLNCNHPQKAAYPSGINAPIQYGPGVLIRIAYFNVFQYIPFRRLQTLFKDVFNLPISEGSIQNMLERASQKARPVYDTIRAKLEQATQVGSDETGAKVNGVKWWIWVWQNISNTFLKASDNRGSRTIDETFPNGFPNATIGSDRWAAQLKTKTKGKQLCLPHLQRDLVWLEEQQKHPWASYFKKLLRDALALRKVAEQRGSPFVKGKNAQTYKLEHRLNRLLVRPIVKEQFPETGAFQKSMIKYRNCIFPFLYDLEIPPDNNASERAIRNVKVKQKISGQFKTGQNIF